MSPDPDAFLDTNIFLRHLMSDHPEHSPRATALLDAIRDGHRVVRIADTVVFETVFTLEKTYRIPRHEIRGAMQPLLELPGIVLPGKQLYRDVFGFWVNERGLSFADCYHLLFAKQHHLPSIISFDRKLGRLDGISRVEP